MQEQWSYGTDLLKEGNEVEIAMQAVDGYYPATAGITLTTDVVDYALYTMQPFVGAPGLELYTDEGLVATYVFDATANGCSATVGEDLGASGVLTWLTLDDSSNTFVVHTRYRHVQVAGMSSVGIRVSGPDEACTVEIDPQNSGLQRVAILESPYPLEALPGRNDRRIAFSDRLDSGRLLTGG